MLKFKQSTTQNRPHKTASNGDMPPHWMVSCLSGEALERYMVVETVRTASLSLTAKSHSTIRHIHMYILTGTVLRKYTCICSN